MSLDKVSKLFRHEVRFIMGAARINQLPNLILPEVAFVGKSNVGKSSLINALCTNQNLAKVSNSPGRTQQINFFSVNDIFTLVDLPGYGFAKVPVYIKDQWQKLIMFYLENGRNLKLVNVLIDSRRGIKDHDQDIIRILLSMKLELQIVLTKSDKIRNSKKIHDEIVNFLATLGYSCNLISASAKTKDGIRMLQRAIASAVK